MNSKKIAALVTAGILSTSALAFAADANSSTSANSSTGQRPSTTSTQKPQRTLTAEEKADMEAKRAQREAAQSKWSALSASQKNEVYAIEEEIVKLEKEKLDKLVSLGVIDKTTADAQKAKLDEKLANLKSSGELSFGRGKGGRPKNTSTTQSSTTNS